MKTENATFINTLLALLPQDLMKQDLAESLQAPKPGKTFNHFTDIKTFADACEALGSTEELFNSAFLGLNLDQDTINYERLKIAVKAINQGWTPDWSNTNQPKYYPWFEVLPSGSGFSDSYSGYLCDGTCVGSRLCFESSEKCKYAATQFEEIYAGFHL